MLESLLNLLYPNVCGFCGSLNKNSLCESCEEKLNRTIINKIDYYDDMYFAEHYYLFKYKDEIRNYILDYKFNDKSYLYKSFAKIIIKNEKKCDFFEKYDIIIPVPIHNKRKNERGYNQSELIARDIAKSSSLKLVKNSLIKVKNNSKQSTLNKDERRINTVGAYEVINKEQIQNKSIILLDDIFTTGNTVNECSKVLIKNGAKNIGILSIAKD